MNSVAPELIANTIAGRLDLIRQNESLRAQLAKCSAARAHLQTQLAIVTNERSIAPQKEKQSHDRL